MIFHIPEQYFSRSLQQKMNSTEELRQMLQIVTKDQTIHWFYCQSIVYNFE